MDDWEEKVNKWFDFFLVVPFNLIVRGFQLWFCWLALKSVWDAGLDAWPVGLLFFCIYMFFVRMIEGLMLAPQSRYWGGGKGRR